MDYSGKYIEIMAARVNDLDREIGELEAIADKAVEEIKADYHKQIKELLFKKEELQNKVTQIREASGSAWEDMKAGTELSWEVFNDSVIKAKSKTKQ
jgi:phage host-nuclease inhibitor protein Gam